LDEYKLKLVRKLKFECKKLQEELRETHLIHEGAVPLFCEHLSKVCQEEGIPNPLDKLAQENCPSAGDVHEAYIAETLTDTQKKELPSQFRKVFKNIVVQTHPDKTQNEDGRELYEQAVEAKKENKVGALLSVAQDLKLNLSHLSYSAIREIESQIERTEKEIDSLRRSYPWHWYYAPQLKKEKIIKEFCGIYKV
jgi:hypothetical protein